MSEEKVYVVMNRILPSMVDRLGHTVAIYKDEESSMNHALDANKAFLDMPNLTVLPYWVEEWTISENK